MKKEASKWSNAHIKYDTVDGYINKCINFALNASNDWILLEHDRCSFSMHAFSQECDERAFWMVLPTSESSAVSQTPKLLRFATLLTFEEKISSQHFTAFLVQKTPQKNLENLFLRNLCRHGCCKIVISTTVTYVTLRTHALVDTGTCYTCLIDLAGTRKNVNFDWRLGTANPENRDIWLFTRCGQLQDARMPFQELTKSNIYWCTPRVFPAEIFQVP